ncbi:MAG TPA: DUF3108 domain-containing protein [Burkholderiales bacterium]|jgi:hypothetical protein|nr:DUF3108 domain-containing protein [Burkholderiales bacterium]
MKHVTSLVLLLLAGPLPAAQPPQKVQIDYAVTSGSMKLGEGHDFLEHDGKKYSVVSETRTVGLAALFYKLNIHRESRGLLTVGGLRPLQFEENNSRKPRRAAEFDWDAGQVKLTDGDKIETVPLSANTFDPTSLPYAFAFAQSNQESMKVFVADGRRLADYEYRIIGKETLKTPLGDLETLHFQKVREADDKRGLEFWLSVERHFLPVRIRYVEKNGTVVDSTVTSITFR